MRLVAVNQLLAHKQRIEHFHVNSRTTHDDGLFTMSTLVYGEVAAFNQDPLRRLLVKGATVVSLDANVGDLVPGDVLVEGETILAVGADLSGLPQAEGATEFDAHGLIVLPGFTDCHRHCWQGQLKRLLPDLESPEAYMSVVLETFAPGYEPEDVYAGTLISSLTALDSGITTVLDFCHNVRSVEHALAALRAHEESGIRAVLAACPPWADGYQGRWSADLDTVRDSLPACGLITLRRAVAGRPIARPDVSLSPETLSFARARDLKVTVDGVIGPVSSELIEGLAQAGLLGADITFLHCIDLTDACWDAIQLAGAGVVLAGVSDAMIGMGGGSFPVQACLDRDVNPGLSTDVEVSLPGDMFSQMRGVLQHQRLGAHRSRYTGHGDLPLLSVRHVLEMATLHGQRNCGLDGRAGSITPGRQADLVLLRTDQLNMIPANNIVGSIVLGADAGNVHSVLVGGRIRKFDGRLIDLDLDAVRAAVERSRDRILERAGSMLTHSLRKG